MTTIKDVANRLGISDATVSRAFSGKTYVSPELKERIFQLAKELNYRPNPHAVALRTNKTNVIALIVPNITNPIYVEFVRNIERFSGEDGYNVILCNTDENISKEQRHVEMLSTGLISGVILVPCMRNENTEEYIHSIDVNRIVLYNRNIENVKFDIVKADHYKGIYSAVNHFYNLGYRKIAAIVGEVMTSVSCERYDGFMNAMKELGLQIDGKLIKYGDLSSECGYTSMMELLNLKNKPEAIIIFNNILCTGCIRALRENKIKVPLDVALITVDEINNSELIEPQLTFIRQPLFDMSKKVYNLLIKKINSNSDMSKSKKQKIILFPTELVVLDSCGQS